MKKKSKIPPLAAGQFWRMGNGRVVVIRPWRDAYFEVRCPITGEEINNHWYKNREQIGTVHASGNCRPGFDISSELVEYLGVIQEDYNVRGGTCLVSAKADREIARLKKRLDWFEREKEEAISMLNNIGPITCANGKAHARHDGCLYCHRDEALRHVRQLLKVALFSTATIKAEAFLKQVQEADRNMRKARKKK